MDCRITNIGINKDGEYILKVMTNSPEAVTLRIGYCEIEQTELKK